jgi:hypothetical protein
MNASKTPDPDPGDAAARQEEKPAQQGAVAEPEAATAGESEAESTLSRRRRLRRPSLAEASAFVALVGGIVGLVFTFAPSCRPQPPPGAVKATISDIRAVRPVSFRRFLQRQQIPISPDMTSQFLARRGVMVEFHYEIIGLSGKPLPLSWQLSDASTNELVSAEQSAYKLTPSKDDDAGDWAIWIPAPKPGRAYYVTVTIFKPQGPPYELKHFDTVRFRGFGST